MDTAAREKEIEERLLKDQQAEKERKEVEKVVFFKCKIVF